MPPIFLIKKSILVVSDLIQSWCLILGIFSTPPCLASIKCVSSLYIILSLPLSFRALQSCLRIHLKYAFFSENASILNMSCGSCVTMFGVHLEKPQIFFWIAIIFLSSLMMASKEYGIA